MAREQTNKLYDMITDGLPAMDVVVMFMKWCSEQDVAEMMDANELSDRFNEPDPEQSPAPGKPDPTTPNIGTQK